MRDKVELDSFHAAVKAVGGSNCEHCLTCDNCMTYLLKCFRGDIALPAGQGGWAQAAGDDIKRWIKIKHE